MSQKKTIVPGMEYVETNTTNRTSETDLYSRNTPSNINSKGTIVPGMDSSSNHEREMQVSSPRGHGKPVIGFLYSISRSGAGEYWPLYIGQNTIGNSHQCNIPLYEGTVSEEHAILVVRKMKNPEKTVASISDARSTNGTMVNGESLGFNAVECFNGDIITIGENYELLLLLIDMKVLGLKISENFIATNDTLINAELTEQMPPAFNPETKFGNTNPPNPYQSNPSLLRGESDGGTVGLDGTSQQVRPGGTVGM